MAASARASASPCAAVPLAGPGTERMERSGVQWCLAPCWDRTGRAVRPVVTDKRPKGCENSGNETQGVLTRQYPRAREKDALGTSWVPAFQHPRRPRPRSPQSATRNRATAQPTRDGKIVSPSASVPGACRSADAELTPGDSPHSIRKAGQASNAVALDQALPWLTFHCPYADAAICSGVPAGRVCVASVARLAPLSSARSALACALCAVRSQHGTPGAWTLRRGPCSAGSASHTVLCNSQQTPSLAPALSFRV